MAEKLVSVIVPVYNVESFLPRCLQAIADQTYPNLDIILVDDGSTDRSGLLCEAFAEKDARCRVFHQENQGIWAARNTGQRAARGEFLFFPDGDDYFHRDMVRQMVEAIDSGPGYDMAIVGFKKTFSTEEDTAAPVSGLWVEDSLERLLKGVLVEKNLVFVVMWNKLFRRSFLGSQETNPCPLAEDYDFNLRCYGKAPRVIRTDSVLYFYLKRPGSITNRLEFSSLDSLCQIRTNDDLLQHGSPSLRSYRYLLLEHLFRNHAMCRAFSLDSDEDKACRRRSREIVKRNFWDYVKEKRISGKTKLVTLASLCFPRLLRAGLKFLDAHPAAAARYNRENANR